MLSVIGLQNKDERCLTNLTFDNMLMVIVLLTKVTKFLFNFMLTIFQCSLVYLQNIQIM